MNAAEPTIRVTPELAVGSAAALVVLVCLIGWWALWLRRRLRQREARIASHERSLQTVIDELPEATVIVGADGVVQRATGGTRGVLSALFPNVAFETDGAREDHSALAGRAFVPSVAVGVQSRTQRWFERLVDGDANGEPFECVVADQDGQARTIELVGELSKLDEGVAANGARPMPRSITIVVRDVTETARLRTQLAAADARYDEAVGSAPTGIAMVRTEDGRIIEANQALATLLGMPVNLLIGCTMREFVHPEDGPETQRLQAQLEMDAIEDFVVDQRLRRTDGDHVWTTTRYHRFNDDGLAVAVVHVQDITDSVLGAERLRYVAHHDDMTGLPHRNTVNDLIGERLQTHPANTSVLLADLDRFRYINDSLGHRAGDAMLRLVARRLRAALSPSTAVARFGGDEFVVVTDESPELAATAIQQATVEPFSLDGQDLFVTFSIGVATAVDHSTVNDLIRDADAAANRAKARGGNCVEYYAPDGVESATRALRTTGEIRRGLSRGEFVPYFQPIVNLRSGEVTGYEALVRWLHPDRGLLHPDDFMGLLEEVGLVGELGWMMFRESLGQAARWRAQPAGPHQPLTLSLNVSTHQLLDPNFLPGVVNLLTESAFDPDRVWLEITEHALLADERHSADRLTELRSLGLHLAVDDFGTGYSSLTYLKRFPVEAIKIDKTFVNGLGIDNEDSSIVEAVARLGQSLGLRVIGEGVESPLQLQRLRDLGVDDGQGYLFGRARPANLIDAFVGPTDER